MFPELTECRISTQCARKEHLLICTLHIHFHIYLKEQCRTECEALHVWRDHVWALGSIHCDCRQNSVHETMVVDYSCGWAVNSSASPLNPRSRRTRGDSTCIPTLEAHHCSYRIASAPKFPKAVPHLHRRPAAPPATPGKETTPTRFWDEKLFLYVISITGWGSACAAAHGQCCYSLDETEFLLIAALWHDYLST